MAVFTHHLGSMTYASSYFPANEASQPQRSAQRMPDDLPMAVGEIVFASNYDGRSVL